MKKLIKMMPKFLIMFMLFTFSVGIVGENYINTITIVKAVKDKPDETNKSTIEASTSFDKIKSGVTKIVLAILTIIFLIMLFKEGKEVLKGQGGGSIGKMVGMILSYVALIIIIVLVSNGKILDFSGNISKTTDAVVNNLSKDFD